MPRTLVAERQSSARAGDVAVTAHAAPNMASPPTRRRADHNEKRAAFIDAAAYRAARHRPSAPATMDVANRGR
jgi:hypothetical protein